MLRQEYLCDICEKQIDGTSRDGIAIHFYEPLNFTFIHFKNCEAQSKHLCWRCIDQIRKQTKDETK